MNHTGHPILSSVESSCMDAADAYAQEAYKSGNLPIGAVIVLDGEIIAGGGSAIYRPECNPWRHAECEALRCVPHELWKRAHDMVIYTTLEPCIMCLSTLILHGVGKIVYGACDTRGGGCCIMDHLPTFYHDKPLPEIRGPVDPARFDRYYQIADQLFVAN